MDISNKSSIKILGSLLLGAMFFLLGALFLSYGTSTASASSCGTAYLYTSTCRQFCIYNPGNNTTTCEENTYEQWTAPPAKRLKSQTLKIYQGYWENSCSTFCT